jgi:predicted nucleotidyltransferase
MPTDPIVPGRTMVQQQPDLGPSFLSVLARVVESLRAAEVPYGILGGVAAAAYGRPRCTKDIDVFCRPEDADRILDVLEGEGFAVERTNPAWIFKAWSDEVVVDVIFRTKGEVYFDDEMRSRVQCRDISGIQVPLIPPEDLVVTKALAMDETAPGHWWDALCIIANNELDWSYLLERARKGPNRVASVLHFALSTDLIVPTAVVRALDEQIAYSWVGAAPEELPWTRR